MATEWQLRSVHSTDLTVFAWKLCRIFYQGDFLGGCCCWNPIRAKEEHPSRHQKYWSRVSLSPDPDLSILI